VIEHIVARGPTELVPSGTSQGFKDVLLSGRRQQAIQRLAAWKVRRRPAPSYGYPEIRLSPLLSLAEAVFALGLCLAQEGILDDAMGRHLLATGCLGVPDVLIPRVWKALKLHFAYPPVSIGIEGLYKARGEQSVDPQHGGPVF
jgi:hypothetical protein